MSLTIKSASHALLIGNIMIDTVVLEQEETPALLIMKPEYSGDETICVDHPKLCYSIPFLFRLEDTDLCWQSNTDGAREHKRLKQEPGTTDELIGGTSCYKTGRFVSTSNFRRLQFRDYVWAYAERYLAFEAVEEAAAAGRMGCEKQEVKEEMGSGSREGMQLLQQLIACAEAVACRDKRYASQLLSELKSNALVFGTSFQRVASCFVQGLSDRLAQVQPLGTVGIPHGIPAKTVPFSAERDEAFRLVYEICPQIQFAHFIANASILEAFEGESSIHIIDLGMTLGLPNGQQWCQLMNSLANKTEKPLCCLRITGIGNSPERVRAIGDELELYAQSLGLNFEFSSVTSSLENLKLKDLHVVDGEAVVINSILQLHCVVKESRGALNCVLQIMRELSPRLLIVAEQDSSHNGPFFLGRFMEALHYYSAIFDSLDSMLPKYDTRRAKMEQFFFGEEIKNIVSCEGAARVERHEKFDQWRRRMSRAGFQAAAMKMTTEAKQWLEKAEFCQGYTVTEERGGLVLGWKSKPIIATSCWKSSYQ